MLKTINSHQSTPENESSEHSKPNLHHTPTVNHKTYGTVMSLDTQKTIWKSEKNSIKGIL